MDLLRRTGQALVTVIGLASIVSGCASPGSGDASPTTATGPAAAPSAVVVRALTETFVSPLYGFTIKHPVTFEGRAATEELMGAAAPLIDSALVDQLSSRAGAVVVMASAGLDAGATLQDWTAKTALAFCGTASSSESLTLDGEPATLTTFATCPGTGLFIQWVTSVREDRGYHVFWANPRGSEATDRALFLDMLDAFEFGPAASASPGPSAAGLRASEDGEPVPDAMLGAWSHPSGAFWWFLRAGAPTCVTVAHTTLDCLAYQLVGQPAYVGVATMDGRVLHIRWVRGYCAGDKTSFGTGFVGETLKLFDLPDDCGGADFVLARAGTGATASAPPPPTH